ncbi:unnamed protein product [Camellia sinensis]
MFLNLGAMMVSNNQLFHLFLFLCFFQITCLHAQLCTQEQSSALLQFKQQFSFDKSASDYCYSVGIHSYLKMESWKEGSDCCSWDGVECDNNTSRVIGLDLSCSWLQGTIHPNSTIFYYFPHLQRLNLAFNDFGMSRISSEFSRFTRLTHLNLSWSSFSGKVPIEVFFLSKLVSLDLSYNYGLRFEEPGFELLVQNLTKVRELNLDSVDCLVSNSLLNLTSLTFLDLSSCGLVGKFPDGIFHLPHLNELRIFDNLALTGYFPEFINSSSPLQYLVLSYTDFSGELISNSLLNLTSLTHLELSSCGLRGKFPDGIFQLPHLNELIIDDNLALTGYFPEFINSSSPLQFLVLSSTNFSGKLPDSIGNLKSLKVLDASGCKFYGSIPTSLGNLTELTHLVIGYNNFTGMLPTSLSNLGNLFDLGVQCNNFEGLSNNQLRGPLPSQIIGLPNLAWLSLGDNLINGTIPSWVFSLPALNYFNLSNNKLTGHVKEFKSTHLTIVDLSNNNLHGKFPSSTFKLMNLNSLILSSNNFSGNFYILDLQKNNFSGTIPDAFVKENYIITINLDSNGFEGPVPKSLVNCEMLQVLDLGHNKFFDKFPYWLENLNSLQVLSLRSNKFHGPIPNSKFKFPFPNLRVMDLSNNYFTGPLPGKYFKKLNAMMDVNESSFELQYLGMSSNSLYYYNDCLTIVIKGSTIKMVKVLTIFTAIDLSKNNFEGQIPQIIGKLNSIRGLNLSHNSLTGHIPASLANLTMLEWLDLSSNKLTGEIPQQLRNLKSLEVLNLSQNQLIGPIPQGNQFDTFLNGSYIDNLALCGPPLLNACNPRTPQPPPLMFQQEDNTSSGFYWEVILPGYICGLVWGLVMGYFMFSRGKPQWLVRIIGGERNKSGKRFKKHSHRNRAR